MSSTPDECGIGAFGTFRATLRDMPALRKKPGPPMDDPLPISLLKHADEHTVAGVAAVRRAIHDFGMQGRSFADWGVVGAPRFPGRLCVMDAVDRFLQEGPLGVSPHIISQRSTHSLSGTISLAFQMRGPNFGVGGGEGALVEGLLSALALVVEDRPPGLWLVLTEWDPEPAPDGSGPSAEQAICHAVALALVPGPAGGAALRLRLVSPTTNAPAAAPVTVASLARFLDECGTTSSPSSWICPLAWGAVLDLAAPAGTGWPLRGEEQTSGGTGTSVGVKA